jgi:hypothetical protein
VTADAEGGPVPAGVAHGVHPPGSAGVELNRTPAYESMQRASGLSEEARSEARGAAQQWHISGSGV